MYLEIDEGFDEHPKTIRLCRVMGDVNAGQYLVRLWAWACRSAQDGDLSGMAAEDIERAAKYDPKDGKLFAALTEKWSPKFSPWLDRDGDRLLIHGWDERQGAAIKRMEKNAARMRAARDKNNRSRDGNVQSTCDARSSHVLSSPDQSSPDKKEESLSERDPSATTTEHVAEHPKIPTAYDWASLFAAKYWVAHGKQYGRGDSDGKAEGRFRDYLESLPPEQRLTDWAARDRILTEFLCSTDRATVAAGWPFSFFAAAFRGLSIPPDKRPKPDARPGQPKQVTYDRL